MKVLYFILFVIMMVLVMFGNVVRASNKQEVKSVVGTKNVQLD